jgi:membrane protease YdiL (CAAX protease family)
VRLFLTTVAAVVASFVIGLGVMLAGAALESCPGDLAGCGVVSALQALIIPVEVLIVAVANVISALRRQRELAFWRCFLTLMLVPVCLLVLAVASDFSSGRQTEMADVLASLQGTLPFWTIVLVQWLMFRSLLARQDRAQEA